MMDALAVARAFQMAWDAHDLEATLALVTDDRVVQQWRRGEVRGVALFRVRDGRISEKSGYVKLG
jgi:hypothetical protein